MSQFICTVCSVLSESWGDMTIFWLTRSWGLSLTKQCRSTTGKIEGGSSDRMDPLIFTYFASGDQCYEHTNVRSNAMNNVRQGTIPSLLLPFVSRKTINGHFFGVAIAGFFAVQRPTQHLRGMTHDRMAKMTANIQTARPKFPHRSIHLGSAIPSASIAFVTRTRWLGYYI